MDKIVDMLVHQWLWDVSVFSEPWLYYTVLPAYLFLIFFIVKWSVITFPVWFPILLIIGSFRK